MSSSESLHTHIFIFVVKTMQLLKQSPINTVLEASLKKLPLQKILSKSLTRVATSGCKISDVTIASFSVFVVRDKIGFHPIKQCSSDMTATNTRNMTHANPSLEFAVNARKLSSPGRIP